MTVNFSKLKWTVIGAGNGGQSVSGHLGLMGFCVKLYDIYFETVEIINKQGGIFLEGSVEGFGKIEYATDCIEDAISGADIIMVVAPALAHSDIAKKCAPYLKDGQIIFIHPGATFGALAFNKTLKDENCEAKVIIAESSTLIYACRSVKQGTARILGIKDRLLVSAFPSYKTENVVNILRAAYPQIIGVDNVMITSLDNTNPIIHPAATLLNTSMVESDRDWLFYWEGITPSIGRFLEDMDEERLSIASMLGLNIDSMKDQYRIEYKADAKTLYEAFRKTEAYSGVKGQKTLNTRYLLEDVPMGLIPLVSLGKKVGVNVDRMELIIKLSEFMLHKDLTSNGRTLETLGLDNLSIKELMEFIKTGKL